MSTAMFPRSETVTERLGPKATGAQITQATHSLQVLSFNAGEPEPYNIRMLGRDFIVLPSVFSPKYFDSTQIFTEHIPIRVGDRFLEIGAGTGITSVIAALRGAHSVISVDVNPSAVQNVLENAKLNKVQHLVSARISDIFSEIHADEKFDSIYWNLPFIYVQRNFRFQTMLERSLFDPGYSNTKRFLSQAAGYLNPEGSVFIGFGNFGEISLLKNIAEKFGYSISEVIRRRGFEGVDVEFILYKLKFLGRLVSSDLENLEALSPRS